MAIQIHRSPEPLSEQSFRAGEEGRVYTAPSFARRILKEELVRYCDGQIQGRSFLIAGHRGTGKTTMVSDVLTAVIKLSQEEQVALRPLPVLLHGPSLFRALPSDYEKMTAPPAAPAAGAASRAAPAVPALDEDTKVELQAQLALKQIILGLHRAVVREYAAAYRRALLPERGRPASAGAAWVESGELAAQFELELMEDPPAARLREMWDHIGALDAGILYPKGRPADLQQARLARENRQAPLLVADQGARELVALNGICNAHQRISGELSGETTQKSTATSAREKTIGMDLKTAEAMKPLAALLSGAVVAGGSAAGGLVQLPGAVALGLATAVASSIVLKRSSTTTGKRERQTDRKFIPDLSVRTLDRVLPTLLERLHNAGLAPVFVIDELDKVDGLSDRIIAMVHYLKKLVAESVFTCFLTDRGYLEYLRLATREKAYSVAYSYFSHFLLVVHEPADFDAYLEDVLRLPDGANASSDDVTDRAILKWALRHRSKMHALDLVRELVALRAEGGNCNIPPGTVRRTSYYRIDATLQVAIEFFLASPAVVGWVLQRPNMRQTLLDALYYVSRVWLSGAAEIDLRPAAKEAFRNSLYKRMNLDEVYRRRPGERHDDVPFDARRTLITDDDLTLLHRTVCELAELLASGSAAKDRIKTKWPRYRLEREGEPKASRPEQRVLDTLMLGDRSSLLIGDPNRPGLYTFRYWQSGELRDASAAREPSEIRRDAEPLLAFLDALQGSLASLLSGSAASPAAVGAVVPDSGSAA